MNGYLMMGAGGGEGGVGNLSVEVEIVSVASCYRSQEKFRLCMVLMKTVMYVWYGAGGGGRVMGHGRESIGRG